MIALYQKDSEWVSDVTYNILYTIDNATDLTQDP